MNAVDERPPVADRVAAAREARDEGIAQVENAADPRVILAIDAEIQKAIASGRRFSANTIRDKFPVCDEHLVGGRVNSFANKRVDGHALMVAIGREPSSLKSTHAHEIKVWLGWDAYQAVNRRRSAAS